MHAKVTLTPWHMVSWREWGHKALLHLFDVHQKAKNMHRTLVGPTYCLHLPFRSKNWAFLCVVLVSLLYCLSQPAQFEGDSWKIKSMLFFLVSMCMWVCLLMLINLFLTFWCQDLLLPFVRFSLWHVNYLSPHLLSSLSVLCFIALALFLLLLFLVFC